MSDGPNQSANHVVTSDPPQTPEKCAIEFRDVAAELDRSADDNSSLPPEVAVLLYGSRAFFLLFTAVQERWIEAPLDKYAAIYGHNFWESPHLWIVAESSWRHECIDIARWHPEILINAPMIRELYSLFGGSIPSFESDEFRRQVQINEPSGDSPREPHANRARRYSAICNEVAEWLDSVANRPLVPDASAFSKLMGVSIPHPDTPPPTEVGSVCGEVRQMVKAWHSCQQSLTTQAGQGMLAGFFMNAGHFLGRLQPVLVGTAATLGYNRPLRLHFAKTASPVEFAGRSWPAYHLAAHDLIRAAYFEANSELTRLTSAGVFRCFQADNPFGPNSESILELHNRHRGAIIAAEVQISRKWSVPIIDCEDLLGKLEWEASHLLLDSASIPGSAGILLEREISELDLACNPLTPHQKRVVKFLWSRGHATAFDTLIETCWDGKAVTDEAVDKMITRIKAKWAEVGAGEPWYFKLGFEISPSSRMIKLIRPEQGQR